MPKAADGKCSGQAANQTGEVTLELNFSELQAEGRYYVQLEQRTA